MLQGGKQDQVEKQKLEGLTRKYNATGFMYTEYPHKSFWSKKFGEAEAKNSLKGLFLEGKNSPTLLYVHIPYCQQLCWFCTCHMSITSEYEKVEKYLKHLYREIDLLSEFFKQESMAPNIQEIHLGGGSPTMLREKEFDELVEKLKSIADIKSLKEFSIEIDPRRVDRDRMKYYHEKGINRISFGAQDFDPNVQKAINRVQPAHLIENLLTPDIRKLFENGTNLDIICGLPHQTPETIRKTCEQVVKISPDRVCFNYLHFAPNFAKHQTIMSDGREGRPNRLPDFHERKLLFLEGLKSLTAHGYVRTGYDHFAKPTDSVAQAMQEGKMHWNALGVSPGECVDILGVGVHSYSTIGNSYFQNYYELSDYGAALAKGKLPVFRGWELSRDDLIRRDVILTLRNFFSLDCTTVNEKYKIEFKDYFKKEIAVLGEFVKDGMVDLKDGAVVITELGRQLTNLICRPFDNYYKEDVYEADLGERRDGRSSVQRVTSEIKNKAS
jgi:oxygen-independent coproporphyrinogen III oxidase